MSRSEGAPVLVVGIDGSASSLVALQAALAEAELRGGELHAVHVADFSPALLHLPDGIAISTIDLAESDRAHVWEQVDSALSGSEKIHRVDLEGYPADELVDYCRDAGAQLLVLGTRGRGRLASTFLGSTSLRALERAECDVLIAKP